MSMRSRVAHIDYNHKRMPDLKARYGPLVQVETFSPEAVYLVSSLHPQKRVGDMMAEFDIEPYDACLDRARAVRKEHLPAE